ncbi:MAG: M14 family zinc carboxypeptidase [Promethearchaeota archaeon]
MTSKKNVIFNFFDIEKELYKLKEASNGLMDVKILGYSFEGRPLYAAVIGNGSSRMWIQGRIHGDEPDGAEAILDILKTLINDSEKTKEVLSKITFMFIPCYNPDGSEKGWRGDAFSLDLNHQWMHLRILEEMAKEWDIKVPSVLYKLFMISTESQHYWYAWANFKPHYVIDYHHENENYFTSNSNEPTRLGILIPGNPTFFSKQDHKISKGKSQMAIVAYNEVKELSFCNPTRYSTTSNKGFPRGMGAGVTVGVPGPKGEDPNWASCCVGFESIPKGKGSLNRDRKISIRQFVAGAWGIINAIVSGELHKADPKDFWDKNKVPIMVRCTK